MLRSRPWRAWGIAIHLLCGLTLFGPAGPIYSMTYDEAQTLWASGQIATATVNQLASARQAFLDQAAGATDVAVKSEAAYRAALCLYYLKRTDKEDKSFHKEAGDVIAQYPESPYVDDLAFYQALVFVDREHWSFVVEQMGQFLAAHSGSSFVPQAAYWAAVGLDELNEQGKFSQAVAAFHEKYPNAAADLSLDLDFRLASLPYKNKQWKDAQAALSAFAGQHSQTAPGTEAAYRAAMCLYEMAFGNRFKDAAAAFAQQYPASARLADLKLREALLPYRMEDWAGARTAIADFITSHPTAQSLAEAEYCLAIANHHLKDAAALASAASSYRERYGAGDHADEIDFRVAEFPFGQEKWTEARTTLSQFVSAHANSKWAPPAAFEAALCAAYAGDASAFKAGIEDFQKQYPNESVVEQVTNRIDALGAREKWDAAVKTADLFLTDFADLPEAFRLQYLKGKALLLQEHQTASEDMISTTTERWQQGVALTDQFVAMADTILTSDSETLMANVNRKNHLQGIICDALIYKMDYAALAERAAQYADEHADDPVVRARLNNWEGIALLHKKDPDVAAATKIFDDIIESSVVDTNFDSHVAIQALEWRISIAQNAGDLTKARDLVVLLRDQMPDCPQKTKVYESYRGVLEEAP